MLFTSIFFFTFLGYAYYLPPAFMAIIENEQKTFLWLALALIVFYPLITWALSTSNNPFTVLVKFKSWYAIFCNTAIILWPAFFFKIIAISAKQKDKNNNIAGYIVLGFLGTFITFFDPSVASKCGTQIELYLKNFSDAV